MGLLRRFDAGRKLRQPLSGPAEFGLVTVAVEVGFEPTEGLPPHTLSRRAPSATRRLHRRRAYPNPRVREGGTYPPSARRAAKKSRSRSPHSAARTPPMTSGRWFRRGSRSTSPSDPTAPPLG